MKRSISIRSYLFISHAILLATSLGAIGFIWSRNEYQVLTQELQKLVVQRVELLSICLKNNPNIEIDSFGGLLVDYAANKKAHAILRGLRAVSDFEYEFQLALMNRRLNREVQTVFLMTGMRWIFTSSSIIKEAAQFGGNINGMVPAEVNKRLKEKFGKA